MKNLFKYIVLASLCFGSIPMAKAGAPVAPTPAEEQTALQLAISYVNKVDGGFYAKAKNEGMQLVSDYGYTGTNSYMDLMLEDPRTETGYHFLVVFSRNSAPPITVIARDVGGSVSSTKWVQEGGAGAAHCFFHPKDAECNDPNSGNGL